MSEGMLRFLLFFAGTCYGLLSAAGVFTVLVAVGLVPRFAGKTHTGRFVALYEEMVIAGTIAGGVLSVFGDDWEREKFFRWLENAHPFLEKAWMTAGILFLAAFGLFCGMFIGCLALAIAEMLDSIPIFARRISFRHGIGLAVLSMAVGKVTGSWLYFLWELYETGS